MRILFAWLFGVLRFGREIQPKNWNSTILAGSDKSDSGIIIFGGLSANATQSLVQVARLFYKKYSGTVHVWCLNLSGHNGKFFDFTQSRMWHWIYEGYAKLFKMIKVLGKSDIVLVGHSTGGLVVLCLLLVFKIRKAFSPEKNRNIRIRAALIFPAFRLKSRVDESMLLIAAILYYIMCPAVFLYLAFSSFKFMILAGVALFLHFMLVPRIWIPSGDNSNQIARKPSWMLSEVVLLSILCLGFLIMPVFIVGINYFSPDYSQTALALFIMSLICTPFLIKQKKVTEGKSESKSGYDYLPIVTTANLILLQLVIRPFLGLIDSEILILESDADKVVKVTPWCFNSLDKRSKVTSVKLTSVPHSQWERDHQVEVFDHISGWLDDK
ncbi:MAG TPA: alpha/beta fold hydrolase [Oligoflexia bacterium]|nr:alpha/beta fold hydrolase [Oligoflexia bacterium]HMP49235.1 alpha/beta fold hydrolase [Oligoflexia bacterium]